MGIKKKILDAMDIFLGILREKTLQTLEEVDASTTDEYWVGAGAVAELNNNLRSRTDWIMDSTGKITGYKTPGGADTVFPFRAIEDLFKISNCVHEMIMLINSDTQVIIDGFTPGKHYLVFIHSYGGTIINVVSGASTIWNIDNGDFTYSRSACLLIKANSESVIFTKTYGNLSHRYTYAWNIFKLD